MRRPHKKVRTGCAMCKQRKIKCDEQWPVCKRCRDRGYECQQTAPRSTLSPSVLVLDAAELRMMDLELMHHFTSSTYQTLTTDPVTRDLWRTGVIRMALSCDYLMLSILSVSALHMKHLYPTRSQEMEAQAVLYHEEASRLIVGVIGDEGTDRNEKFLFSVLTIFYGKCLRWQPMPRNSTLIKADLRTCAEALGSHSEDDLSGLGGYPLWLTLIQGCTAFLGDSGDDIANGPLSAMMSHARARQEIRLSASPTDYLHELRGLIKTSVAENDRQRKYMTVIDELNHSLAVIYQTSGAFDLVDVFIWVVFAEDLIHLLQRQEKEALATFAHFCLLLNRLPPSWWLGNQTVQLMGAITHALGESHRGWIRWPLEEIEGGRGKGSWRKTAQTTCHYSEVPARQSW